MPKKSPFSDAQIIAAIKEIEGGATVIDTARSLGVSKQTLIRWRHKFGGMEVTAVQEKRRLEDENRRLKKLVAQFAMEIDVLKGALGKKW